MRRWRGDERASPIEGQENAMFIAQPIELDDAVVVQCEGRLVRSEAAYLLRNVILAHRAWPRIIVDFSGVTAIEGGGLGMLACLIRWAKTEEKVLRVACLPDGVRNHLKMLGEEVQNDDCEKNVLGLVGLPTRPYWVATTVAA
jgi:anti-anti-sigma regulatory factor